MAYKITDVNGYGTGALGTVTNPTGQINSYARVTAVSTDGLTLTIGTPSNGAYETFSAGKEIMFHISGVLSGTDASYLGKTIICRIQSVSGSNIVIDKTVNSVILAAQLANYACQVITVAQFDTLNLSSGSIAPIAYSTTTYYGGILALKCATGLNFSGGKVNLVSMGIPSGTASLRPLTAQETEMSSSGKTTGFENHITARQLLLNVGNGAAWVVAKSTTITGTDSRIGASAAGVAYYPYASGDNNPAEVLGGSTILWVSDTITGFTPKIISKGSGAGAGYGRCYIATNSSLPNDEGLYAQDSISNPAIPRSLGVKDFGTGALGSVTNPTGQINSYARVTAVSADGLTLTIGTPSNGTYETFSAGTTVLVHVTRNTSTDILFFGKFIEAQILSAGNGQLVLSKSINDVMPATSVSQYKIQIVTVAQFDTLIINTAYTAAIAYDDAAGYGGILAIAAKTLLDLRNGGKLNMMSKGLPASITRPSLSWQCSGTQRDYLPLSQGTGAVFLQVKNLLTDTNSRIGGLGDGSIFGGTGGGNTSTPQGYSAPAVSEGLPGYPGTSACGLCGDATTYSGQGGASIFCVADSMTYTSAAFSIGGTSGLGHYNNDEGLTGIPAGSGYGGGAGGGWGCHLGGAGGYTGYGTSTVNGGPGGSSGTCFIYCNTVTSADYTGVVI